MNDKTDIQTFFQSLWASPVMVDEIMDEIMQWAEACMTESDEWEEVLAWLTTEEMTTWDEFDPNILEDSSDLKDICSGAPTGMEETKLSSESVLHQNFWQSSERGSDTL